VIVIDRETNEIVWRLGRDGAHDVLHEQHNPDLLRGPGGRPTVLVSDSENDRVVEYTYDGTWNRTWVLTGLNWPRDADRLPNGNTLVTDTLNHRVIEVTPRGAVVWEVDAPWAPYDAERVRYGDGSRGPTMAELGETGSYEVDGEQEEARHPTVAATMTRLGSGTPLATEARWLGTRWAHVAPFVRPVWLPEWAFVALFGAGLVAGLWGAVELGHLVWRVRPRT
jgi:hypothetical protein